MSRTQAARKTKSSSASPELSFVTFLERRLAATPPPQKGQRTRERIKIATARVLAEKGYHALRVTDVTEAAGVAEGSFYVYYKDKTEASLAVLTSFLQEFSALAFERSRERGSAFDAIQATNRGWFRLCRANTGLLRCILQVGDEVPEFAEFTHRANHLWYERIASSVVRRYPEGALPQEAALLTVYFLGSMMDELARRLVVYPQKDLMVLVDDLDASDDDMADAVSVLWMRCLYPQAPIEGDLGKASRLLAAWPQSPQV